MNMPKVTKPMCAIDEYAISFFMSRCASATKPIYTTAIKRQRDDQPVQLPAGIGRDRQREAQEAVAAHLQHDGGQHHGAAGGRLDVRVGQPGVHRPHRHLHGEGREEGEEDERLFGEA